MNGSVPSQSSPNEGDAREVETLKEELAALRLRYANLEQAATDWRTRLESMVERSPALIWLTDEDGVATYFNQAWLRFTGHSLAEEIADPWWRRIHEEDRESYLAQFQEARRQSSSFSCEFRFRRSDGEFHWLWSENHPLIDATGRRQGFVGNAFDITERKEAELRLQRQESLTRRVLDNSSAAIYVKNLDGTYLLVNRHIEHALHIPAERILGRTDHDLHPKAIADEFRANDQKVLAAGEPTEMEERLELDGDCYTRLSVKFPLNDENGEPFAICGISTDITARKQMEEELRLNEERFRLLIQAASDAIWDWDLIRNTVWWNEGIYQLFGYDPTAVRPDAGWWMENIHPEERVDVLRSIDAFIAEGNGTWTHEYRFKRSDGAYAYVYDRGFVIRDDTGKPLRMVGAMVDLSERKRAEVERRDLELQIQQAQKLESLGILAGGIAHDFNNLLTGILGNASLALLELSPESPIRTYLLQMETAALRAADLTKQMLAYSGKGRFVVQPINLSRVVEEMASLLQTVISKRAILRFDFARTLPAVNADPTQIRQVVMNLITNASDAIGDRSGVIAIRTGALFVTAQYLKTTYLNTDIHEGYYAYVEVSDNGCGMDEETTSRVFDPFFTTKFTGRGLGLAAVLGIVRGHKGAIKIYSEPGHGTTFKALFPATEMEESPESANNAHAPWRSDGTVLVIDDDETVRAVTRHALEKAGLRVLVANDGKEGVDLFQMHANDIDMVLLDLTMPRMGGDEAFRELRLIQPNVKVVLMSGYNEQEIINKFAGKGLAGFVQKPFRAGELFALVREALKKS